MWLTFLFSHSRLITLLQFAPACRYFLGTTTLTFLLTLFCKIAQRLAYSRKLIELVINLMQIIQPKTF